MDSYIGNRLDGRYLVEELVGEGGMANVYRGRDLKDNRVVAIKILKDEFHDNEELVRRFKNEGRAISVLNQQNIVKVYDVSVSDTVQYIVMEHIDGITLKEYIDQRGEPLTYKESIMFTSQVLRALQHAHDKGVVHRDIKPQNIMLTEDGAVKVMDFGIARLARSEIHTDGEQAIGSVHYISPEQAQGASTDPRADIYSTGIMLYEMLSGTLPFESDNAVSIAIKQISDEATPLCEVNPSVPAGLGDITMKAMAKDPKLRYQTALEMLRDIEEFKRDPSVKFEYEYLSDNDAARYKNTVANAKQTGAAGGSTGSAVKKGRHKRRKRHSVLVPIVLGTTVAVVLTCVFLVYSIFQKSGNPLFVDLEDIELPNFVGHKLDEVESELGKKPFTNLRLVVTYEYNESVEPGVVIQQNPASPNGDMMVKENQRLYLTVNEGITQVAIPNIIGMTRSEASDEILKLGVRPYVVAQQNDSVPVGQVFNVEPAVGSYVSNSSTTFVTIYISSAAGSYARTVPDVVGQSLDSARAILEQSDLSVGNIIYRPSNEYEPDHVMDQSPAGGTVKTAGYPVSLIVCEGPEDSGDGGGGEENNEEMVDVPNFRGQNYSALSEWGAANGISVYKEDTVRSSSEEGTILSQTHTGELAKGSAVGATVSGGPDFGLEGEGGEGENGGEENNGGNEGNGEEGGEPGGDDNGDNGEGGDDEGGRDSIFGSIGLGGGDNEAPAVDAALRKKQPITGPRRR